MNYCRLKELTTTALREQASQLPEELRHLTEHALAMIIIQCALGRDFWDREIGSKSQNLSPFLKERRAIKTLHFSDLIWRLKDEVGFLEQLRTKGDNNLESTHFEMVAAELISSTSRDISFVLPSGVKGQDFDLTASDFWGLDLAAIEFNADALRFPAANLCEIS